LKAEAIIDAQIAEEQKHDPDWLKRDAVTAEPAPAPQAAEEPVALPASRPRRTAA
jgi:hypothetical protein